MSKDNKTKSGERREKKPYVEFPLKDKHGNIITQDRRSNSDPHTPVIVTRTDLSENEFKRFFKDKIKVGRKYYNMGESLRTRNQNKKAKEFYDKAVQGFKGEITK